MSLSVKVRSIQMYSVRSVCVCYPGRVCLCMLCTTFWLRDLKAYLLQEWSLHDADSEECWMLLILPLAWTGTLVTVNVVSPRWRPTKKKQTQSVTFNTDHNLEINNELHLVTLSTVTTSQSALMCFLTALNQTCYTNLLSIFYLFLSYSQFTYFYLQNVLTVLIIATWTATYCISYENYKNAYVHKLWTSNPHIAQHYKPHYGKKNQTWHPVMTP